MDYNVNKCAVLAMRGGGGDGWLFKFSDWAHRVFQLFFHLYKSAYSMWKHSNKYLRELDEVFADCE